MPRVVSIKRVARSGRVSREEGSSRPAPSRRPCSGLRREESPASGEGVSPRLVAFSISRCFRSESPLIEWDAFVMGSSKDKPATDSDSGGHTSEENKATSARFAIANAGAGDAEARVIFSTSRCANSESATPDRIAHAGLAQIHSERAEIYGFAVVEAHGSRFRKSDNSRGNYSGSSLHC